MLIASTSLGQTEGQSQRSLQTADELRTMKKGTLLFVNASSPAALLQTIAYFEDRTLAKLANLPFELGFFRQRPMILLDPQRDQEETTAEITTVNVMEPRSAAVRGQGGEMGEEIEVEIEGEATMYTTAPEE